MLFNLYSALPIPLAKKIKEGSQLADKLTTIVMQPLEFAYLHVYERINGVYVYQKTFRLN
ncbi:hypothetical protein ACFTQ7_24655 [Lysinibacillus sp. NPDC056959]|uniref:hypothetical protein n=1 Tax=Lysinibacillus sp. NPDC056959 TaxID=3345981 RepID=UPI00363969B7